MNTTPVIAIQGEPGCNSALAAEQYFGRAPRLLPCATFADIFAAVTEGSAEAALAPLENSLAGSIHDVWRLLLEHPLAIVGEIYYRVEHCLVAHPGVTLKHLRRVFSHEQALAQCRNFLESRHHLQALTTYDTAGAVALIKQQGWRDAAAIAPERAATNHAMEVVARHIQNNSANYTRFFVLAQQESTEVANQTMAILRMENNVRELPTVLSILHNRGIEVLKVETCKDVGQPWTYLVYLEMKGEVPAVLAAQDEMSNNRFSLHLIGSYPAKPRP